MFDPKLKPGQKLSNKELCEIFKCSPQGGMRKSKKTNTLVLISNHVKSIYNDRWIGDVFHYTGMGMEGDQSLNFSQNKTLLSSKSNNIDVHLFEVFEEKIYTYIGRVILADNPYTEIQLDKNGRQRKVWIFPLKLCENNVPILPKEDLENVLKTKERKAKDISNEELLNRAKSSPKQAGTRKVITKQYERNVWVSEYAKRRAKGICQLCGQAAPFKTKNGEPYLEVHHIIWLSQGGEDSIENTVALCPNCHRKMHILNLPGDRKKLLEIAKKLKG